MTSKTYIVTLFLVREQKNRLFWYPDTKISEHRKISHTARSLKEPRVGSPSPRESTTGPQATTMNVFSSSRSPQQLSVSSIKVLTVLCKLWRKQSVCKCLTHNWENI